ncbi:alpha/beta hydrolase [Polynucleobacter brandtiae]|uniref:Arylformamidase n=1 Tax=Polynucleobacter brandtiae TaxID=1938816 RepID=A0A2M8VQW0_9BURK|nr:alpha/beta hydrolase [Polynucleobacter brandtiae]PJI79526.1 arylformamidase [Polynucleobacter brandtiae]
MTTDNISRRTFIIAGSVLAAMPTLGLMAQEKKVFMDWTYSQLNDQLNQGPYLPSAPELQRFATDFSEKSSKFRAQHPPKTFAYGSSNAEKLDVFAPANAKDLPVMIFIHGGEWNVGTKDAYSSLAAPFLQSNAICVVLGFDNIPPNTISGMVGQVRRAIEWVFKNAKQIGADQNKMYVSGHSSGGHLTSMMLVTEWQKQGLPANLFKGGVVLSGWTNLYPDSLSIRQQYLKLKPADIKQFSPVDYAQNVTCPVIVAYGALESPYMQMQSEIWAKKLRSHSRLAGSYRVANHNHYQMPSLFTENNNQVIKATLAMMDLV